MNQNQLIWVDEQDTIIGYGTKLETHRLEQLHRAYSIFLYDNEEQKMLLQKRADGKYHSGGLWSNACCSHPYKDENWGQAIQRGLQNELGLSLALAASGTPVRFIAKFQYYSSYGELSEHEMDYVFLFLADPAQIALITPNPDEIAAIQWMTLEEIEQLLLHSPELFTSWFPQAYQIARKALTECTDRGNLVRQKDSDKKSADTTTRKSFSKRYENHLKPQQSI